jgi:oligosaccharide repeat unit polymerase
MALNLESEPANIARLIVFASLVAVIGAFFLLRPSKDWILRLFYYPLVFYHYRRSKLPALKTALAGTIAVIGIFFCGVVGHLYVRKFDYDTADTLRFLNNNLDNPRQFFDLLLSRFYGIDAIAVIVEHVRRTGTFLMGSSLAELLYWFVPRAIWPDKPFTFSFTFGQLFQSYVGWGGEAYATTTLFGELYLNFGVIGVIFGSFLFGIFIRLYYIYLIRRIQSKSGIMVYAILLIQSVEFTEGPIGAHVALMVSEAVPFLMLLYISWSASSFGRRARAS